VKVIAKAAINRKLFFTILSALSEQTVVKPSALKPSQHKRQTNLRISNALSVMQVTLRKSVPPSSANCSGEMSWARRHELVDLAAKKSGQNQASFPDGFVRANRLEPGCGIS
jgi:hypothetical protein